MVTQQSFTACPISPKLSLAPCHCTAAASLLTGTLPTVEMLPGSQRHWGREPQFAGEGDISIQHIKVSRDPPWTTNPDNGNWNNTFRLRFTF